MSSEPKPVSMPICLAVIRQLNQINDGADTPATLPPFADNLITPLPVEPYMGDEKTLLEVQSKNREITLHNFTYCYRLLTELNLEESDWNVLAQRVQEEKLTEYALDRLHYYQQDLSQGDSTSDDRIIPEMTSKCFSNLMHALSLKFLHIHKEALQAQQPANTFWDEERVCSQYLTCLDIMLVSSTSGFFLYIKNLGENFKPEDEELKVRTKALFDSMWCYYEVLLMVPSWQEALEKNILQTVRDKKNEEYDKLKSYWDGLVDTASHMLDVIIKSHILLTQMRASLPENRRADNSIDHLAVIDVKDRANTISYMMSMIYREPWVSAHQTMFECLYKTDESISLSNNWHTDITALHDKYRIAFDERLLWLSCEKINGKREQSAHNLVHLLLACKSLGKNKDRAYLGKIGILMEALLGSPYTEQGLRDHIGNIFLENHLLRQIQAIKSGEVLSSSTCLMPGALAEIYKHRLGSTAEKNQDTLLTPLINRIDVLTTKYDTRNVAQIFMRLKLLQESFHLLSDVSHIAPPHTKKLNNACVQCMSLLDVCQEIIRKTKWENPIDEEQFWYAGQAVVMHLQALVVRGLVATPAEIERHHAFYQVTPGYPELSERRVFRPNALPPVNRSIERVEADTTSCPTQPNFSWQDFNSQLAKEWSTLDNKTRAERMMFYRYAPNGTPKDIPERAIWWTSYNDLWRVLRAHLKKVGDDAAWLIRDSHLTVFFTHILQCTLLASRENHTIDLKLLDGIADAIWEMHGHYKVLAEKHFHPAQLRELHQKIRGYQRSQIDAKYGGDAPSKKKKKEYESSLKKIKNLQKDFYRAYRPILDMLHVVACLHTQLRAAQTLSDIVGLAILRHVELLLKNTLHEKREIILSSDSIKPMLMAETLVSDVDEITSQIESGIHEDHELSTRLRNSARQVQMLKDLSHHSVQIQFLHRENSDEMTTFTRGFMTDDFRSLVDRTYQNRLTPDLLLSSHHFLRYFEDALKRAGRPLDSEYFEMINYTLSYLEHLTDVSLSRKASAISECDPLILDMKDCLLSLESVFHYLQNNSPSVKIKGANSGPIKKEIVDRIKRLMRIPALHGQHLWHDFALMSMRLFALLAAHPSVLPPKCQLKSSDIDEFYANFLSSTSAGGRILELSESHWRLSHADADHTEAAKTMFTQLKTLYLYYLSGLFFEELCEQIKWVVDQKNLLGVKFPVQKNLTLTREAVSHLMCEKSRTHQQRYHLLGLSLDNILIRSVSNVKEPSIVAQARKNLLKQLYKNVMGPDLMANIVNSADCFMKLYSAIEDALTENYCQSVRDSDLAYFDKLAGEFLNVAVVGNLKKRNKKFDVLAKADGYGDMSYSSLVNFIAVIQSLQPLSTQQVIEIATYQEQITTDLKPQWHDGLSSLCDHALKELISQEATLKKGRELWFNKSVLAIAVKLNLTRSNAQGTDDLKQASGLARLLADELVHQGSALLEVCNAYRTASKENPQDLDKTWDAFILRLQAIKDLLQYMEKHKLLESCEICTELTDALAQFPDLSTLPSNCAANTFQTDNHTFSPTHLAQALRFLALEKSVFLKLMVQDRQRRKAQSAAPAKSTKPPVTKKASKKTGKKKSKKKQPKRPTTQPAKKKKPTVEHSFVSSHTTVQEEDMHYLLESDESDHEDMPSFPSNEAVSAGDTEHSPNPWQMVAKRSKALQPPPIAPEGIVAALSQEEKKPIEKVAHQDEPEKVHEPLSVKLEQGKLEPQREQSSQDTAEETPTKSKSNHKKPTPPASPALKVVCHPPYASRPSTSDNTASTHQGAQMPTEGSNSGLHAKGDAEVASLLSTLSKAVPPPPLMSHPAAVPSNPYRMLPQAMSQPVPPQPMCVPVPAMPAMQYMPLRQPLSQEGQDKHNFISCAIALLRNGHNDFDSVVNQESKQTIIRQLECGPYDMSGCALLIRDWLTPIVRAYQQQPACRDGVLAYRNYIQCLWYATGFIESIGEFSTRLKICLETEAREYCHAQLAKAPGDRDAQACLELIRMREAEVIQRYSHHMGLYANNLML